MSYWTHVSGIIYVEDWSCLDNTASVNLKEVACKGLPSGTEDGLTVEVITRSSIDDEYPNRYKAISIFGELRDFYSKDCDKLKSWWNNLKQEFGKHVEVRQAIMIIEPDDGSEIILKEAMKEQEQ